MEAKRFEKEYYADIAAFDIGLLDALYIYGGNAYIAKLCNQYGKYCSRWI